MKRFFLFLFVLFVFVYFICPHFFSPSYPPSYAAATEMASYIWATHYYYTGQLEEISLGVNQDIIPRYSSLITADGYIYVQVSIENLFSALGYSKSPDTWKFAVKEKLQGKAHRILEVEIKRYKWHNFISRLFLKSTLLNIFDIECFRPYTAEGDRLYLVLAETL